VVPQVVVPEVVVPEMVVLGMVVPARRISGTAMSGWRERPGADWRSLVTSLPANWSRPKGQPRRLPRFGPVEGKAAGKPGWPTSIRGVTWRRYGDSVAAC
jgi:hypothetical protein